MSTTRQTGKPTVDSPGIGRIVPVNMLSETKGLNHDSLIRDTTAGGNAEAECDYHCHLWA